jgi:hypothetical protein
MKNTLRRFAKAQIAICLMAVFSLFTLQAQNPSLQNQQSPNPSLLATVQTQEMDLLACLMLTRRQKAKVFCINLKYAQFKAAKPSEPTLQNLNILQSVEILELLNSKQKTSFKLFWNHHQSNQL